MGHRVLGWIGAAAIATGVALLVVGPPPAWRLALAVALLVAGGAGLAYELVAGRRVAPAIPWPGGFEPGFGDLPSPGPGGFLPGVPGAIAITGREEPPPAAPEPPVTAPAGEPEARSGARFTGQVAVVTGAGRGMGRTVATWLAREGAQVVVAEKVPELAAETVARIEAAGGRAAAIVVDVADVGQVRDLFAQVEARWGRCDVLVNNAGIGVPRPLLEYTEEDWDRQMDVNLKGLFFCTQAAARLMVPAGRGKIVNFASTTAFVSSSMLAEVAYDVSKAGVRQLTVSAAYELAPHGVNVNAVAPGQILTEMTRRGMEDESRRQRALAKIPIGRLGTPEDVAAAVLYLCSAGADYVTGHVLVVDGGWLLH